MTMFDKAFSILYQDHHMLIMNKAAGIVMHPTYKHVDGDTFWDALLLFLQQQGPDDWQPAQLPDDPVWALAPAPVQEMLRQKRRDQLWKEEGLLPRPCLLHRLDKDTSGVVAIARSQRACRYLVKQFYDRSIEKRYVAVVSKGAPIWARPRTTFTVEVRTAHAVTEVADESIDLLTLGDAILTLHGALQRDSDDRRRCIVGPEGLAATTRVRILASNEQFFLVEASPITGRTHQIRAHLAALGYSIVGDKMYGIASEDGEEGANSGAGGAEQQLQRQFLHAYSLTLHRYPDHAVCRFVAPLPDDLVTWMSKNFSTGLGVLNGSTIVPA